MVDSFESSEQKKMFNKMKHDLEGWREVILLVDSVLKWQKSFYPAVIFGVTSFIFLIVWWLSFSTLTLVSLVMLTVILLDYAFPMVSRILFKPENWTGVQEKSFESVCTDICILKAKLCGTLHCVFSSKEDKPIKHLIATCGALFVLAYIGAVIDNLLLSYLGALFVAFYPGLLHNGFVNIVKNHAMNFISPHIKCLQNPGDNKKAE